MLFLILKRLVLSDILILVLGSTELHQRIVKSHFCRNLRFRDTYHTCSRSSGSWSISRSIDIETSNIASRAPQSNTTSQGKEVIKFLLRKFLLVELSQTSNMIAVGTSENLKFLISEGIDIIVKVNLIIFQ